MKKKEEKKYIGGDNYLERIPLQSPELTWSQSGTGKVVLYVCHRGFFHWLAHHLFQKPYVTRIELERMGNFIWPLVDGKRNLIDIGELVREKFGEAAEPLYERLAEYFRTLERNGFIVWKEEPTEEIES